MDQPCAAASLSQNGMEEVLARRHKAVAGGSVERSAQQNLRARPQELSVPSPLAMTNRVFNGLGGVPGVGAMKRCAKRDQWGTPGGASSRGSNANSGARQ